MLKYIRFLVILLFLAIISIFIYKYRRLLPSPKNIVETVIPVPTVIEKNGQPNKHLIKTTFVPQAPEKKWDQPWQDACEESALLTVHYYYQSVSPTLELMVKDLTGIFDFETNQGWSHDVNLSQMAIVSNKLWNYQSKIIENPTIEEITKYLSQDIPVIIPANGKILFQENKHFKSGGPWYHNLVILGYDNDKKIFTVHDVGTQFGAYFHYSYDILMSSIHDFPTSQKKEDINTGVPRVLVLLK